MKVFVGQILTTVAVMLQYTVFGDETTTAIPTDMRNIYTIEDNCVENYCRDFHYPSATEVAFFDIKAEVRINSEDHTYDLVGPVIHNKLVFKRCKFHNFPLHLFYSFPQLRELDMRNSSIHELSWESFLMADNLQILLLSENNIKGLKEMTFSYAPDLEYLFLDNNRLRFVVNESFKGLDHLKFLDLSNNRLSQLPSEIFKHVPQLQELNLSQNRLRVIGSELFASNLNLYSLTLSSNRLHEVSEYALKNQQLLIILVLSHNTELETLVMNLNVRHLVAANCSLYRVNIYGSVTNVDMQDNHISELYFSEPGELFSLNLRNNMLQQISSLSKATNLTMLVLSDNPDLRSLPEPWLAPALERLDLSNTSMKYLPISALAEQSQLHHLNVSNNQIREINPLNFKYLEKLTNFYIHANDWNCYNLNIVMDQLIKPNAMTYTRDTFDPDFPGEYINDIACMYRLEEPEEDSLGYETVSPTETLSEAYQQTERDAETERSVERLESELKVIVQFYEQKFDKVFRIMEDLESRLAAFERLNETYWQDVTIIT